MSAVLSGDWICLNSLSLNDGTSAYLVVHSGAPPGLLFWPQFVPTLQEGGSQDQACRSLFCWISSHWICLTAADQRSVLHSRSWCKHLFSSPLGCLVCSCACCSSLKLLFPKPSGTCKDEMLPQMRPLHHFVDAASPERRRGRKHEVKLITFFFFLYPYPQHPAPVLHPTSLCLYPDPFCIRFVFIFWHLICVQALFIMGIFSGCKR